MNLLKVEAAMFVCRFTRQASQISQISARVSTSASPRISFPGAETQISGFSTALLAQGLRYQSTQEMAGTITYMHRLLDTVA